ncbi:three-helix bundle dimerization domain-containing protein [Amycolatopsis sp. MtRt-6]|uniref:three-helix bundle dimerization domain-containing protein n=1 Tax=Amycolatopsis sp. MtRt-6 TaxID=2792782 RepID=UPI001A905AA7|nr:hypothetical protein [Amycolatopsis sp. MtRt-6]
MSTLDTMASEQLDVHLAQLEERLDRDYANVTRARLHALVDRERARFDGARIHAFLPILVERAVRASLAAT